jgi:hypothetical protein
VVIIAIPGADARRDDECCDRAGLLLGRVAFLLCGFVAAPVR